MTFNNNSEIISNYGIVLGVVQSLHVYYVKEKNYSDMC